jgi:hypothetical protein
MLAAARPSSDGIHPVSSRQGEIGEHRADQRRQAGQQVEGQRPQLAVAGVEQDQVITDFLRNFVGDDGQRGDDAELGIFEEGGSNQDAVDKIVEGIADQDQQAGTSVIVGRGLGVVRLAMIVVAVPPEDQFFQHEEDHDAEQDGCRHAMRIAMFQRVRQDFQEGRAEQRADRVGNQHIDTMRADRNAQGRRRRRR